MRDGQSKGRLEPHEPKPLNTRQERWLQAKGRGATDREAGAFAGFSPSYGKKIANRLRKRPQVVQAMETIQQKGRDLAAYDLGRAMAEAQDTMQFARETKNANAYGKAVELRAKLSGLLIEKHEILRVDLPLALAAATARLEARNKLRLPVLDNGATDPAPSTAQDPRPFTLGPPFGD